MRPALPLRHIFPQAAGGHGLPSGRRKAAGMDNKKKTIMIKKAVIGRAKCVIPTPGYTQEGKVYEFIDNGKHGVAILGARYSCSQSRFKEQFERLPK